MEEGSRHTAWTISNDSNKFLSFKLGDLGEEILIDVVPK
jgi:hypothetical protein